ncbi:MAG: Fructokinase [Frankiales bacterium]|nr:Fructokinase [Frankiales bacterium]
MIVVCGEALIDLVPDDGTGARYTAIPGGSPANAAVALARLDVPTAFLARLSGDSFGRRLRAHLDANKVDLSLAVTADEASSLAIVDLDERGSASYRFDIVGRADWQWRDEEFPVELPGEVVAVHAGSLALTLPPGAPALERFLARCKRSATICIDPNVRPSLGGSVESMRADVTRWCGIADIIKASADDVEVLHPGEDPEEVARRWQSLGPAIAVVTLGADGLVAVTSAGTLRLPAPATTVVDTVAAGDTFTAGMLASLHAAGVLGGRLDAVTTAEFEAALAFGMRAAAITCSRVGADPPYARELA